MKVYPYINKLKDNKINIIKHKFVILGSLLGSGASGSVYKCIIDDRPYCVKVLSSNNYDSLESMFNDWLYYEINISKKVSPSKYMPSLRYISYKQTNKTIYVYIIYDYIDALTLSEFINKSEYWTISNSDVIYSLKFSHKINIIKQLINSVIELHSKYIVHCDLKLDNILIDNNMDIFIIDFGSACLMDDNKHINIDEYNSILGTDGYMAPELYEYSVYYSSDTYSLVICIFEILIGDIWCNNKISLSIIDKYIETHPEMDYSTLKQGLEYDPNNRPILNELYRIFN